MSNSLDPEQAQHFVGPGLGLNCLQKLSADDTIGLKVKRPRLLEINNKTDINFTIILLPNNIGSFLKKGNLVTKLDDFILIKDKPVIV